MTRRNLQYAIGTPGYNELLKKMKLKYQQKKFRNRVKSFKENKKRIRQLRTQLLKRLKDIA